MLIVDFEAADCFDPRLKEVCKMPPVVEGDVIKIHYHLKGPELSFSRNTKAALSVLNDAKHIQVSHNKLDEAEADLLTALKTLRDFKRAIKAKSLVRYLKPGDFFIHHYLYILSNKTFGNFKVAYNVETGALRCLSHIDLVAPVDVRIMHSQEGSPFQRTRLESVKGGENFSDGLGTHLKIAGGQAVCLHDGIIRDCSKSWGHKVKASIYVD